MFGKSIIRVYLLVFISYENHELKSTPDLTVQAVDDVHSLPVDKRCISLHNTDLRENSSGDAPEIRLSSVTSTEFPVSADSPSGAESPVLALMSPATEGDDCCIETPSSVSSPFPPVVDEVTDTSSIYLYVHSQLFHGNFFFPRGNVPLGDFYFTV